MTKTPLPAGCYNGEFVGQIVHFHSLLYERINTGNERFIYRAIQTGSTGYGRPFSIEPIVDKLA